MTDPDEEARERVTTRKPQNQAKGGRGRLLNIGELLIKKGNKDSVLMEGKFRLWKLNA